MDKEYFIEANFSIRAKDMQAAQKWVHDCLNTGSMVKLEISEIVEEEIQTEE